MCIDEIFSSSSERNINFYDLNMEIIKIDVLKTILTNIQIILNKINRI